MDRRYNINLLLTEVTYFLRSRLTDRKCSGGW